MVPGALTIQSAIRLTSGYFIPHLGFGVGYGYGGAFVDPRSATKPCVLEAFKVGYRLIDTAQVYANEAEVGQAFRESGLKREEVFLSTKIYSASHGYESTLSAVDASLNRMGLDYVDLFLIHDASSGKKRRLDTYRALLDARNLGKIKSVGVSNYGVKHLEEIKEAGFDMPVVNQIELHPFCQQKDIVSYCQEHSIAIEAYCPILRGDMDHPVINELAKQYNRDRAQILLRWSLQRGFTPLPRSSKPERIRSNAQIFDFELSEDDMEKLNALDRGKAGSISWNPVDVP
ncbi:Aldo/keto reductase [Gloeophyllum trabeum ATCC 11539]|uniref:Aldo/keto reductase n=1 Tax=Gloeophyllum trabeum (strain ATCC 11539 / FP-39264 / Madison 617) TaxID=670483 RepID=S7RWE2_GLOTA|nr:Aldo/keto reductase [Gloeophyllum trabeum ATCC 11539]EPQ57634.1 Aldo/keto reductase [Gloeophyllum trabeum ATCC 11539]